MHKPKPIDHEDWRPYPTSRLIGKKKKAASPYCIIKGTPLDENNEFEYVEFEFPHNKQQAANVCAMLDHAERIIALIKKFA